MENSQYLEKSKQMLQDVRGKNLSVEERRELAIELAALILNEARRVQTSQEHRILSQLDKMMEDPVGKIFTTAVTDECFRSKRPSRVADQLNYLISKYGIPRFFTYFRQFELGVFKMLGGSFPQVFVPLTKRFIRKETSRVIIPGERRPLVKHMEKRKKEGVRVNLNQLGEAILGEQEAGKKMKLYLEDLSRPEVEYISVKASTLYSQINLIAWEETLRQLEAKLKKLFRQAMEHTYVSAEGKGAPKFVNLDMEEYRDLHLTVEVFRKVLDDPEFYHFSAGIVLQSYLPDSYLILQELTVWAMRRVANGGAPIKIRIVKGANLAMEKVEASIKGWPQAAYKSKSETDANFKRMLHYACLPQHAAAAHIGVGSHNLFDIAYVLLLREENGVEKFIEFEMLEGMAEHIRRVVKEISGGMLLYCPVSKEKDFACAVAYLVRRLDENTAPENFLRHLFGLITGTGQWQEQSNQFSLACHSANVVGLSPRRGQNRFLEPEKKEIDAPFSNDPDTDWSLPQNRKWIQALLEEWKRKEFEDIPLVIGGSRIFTGENLKEGKDPSCPGAVLYRYSLADSEKIDLALKTAEKSQKKWKAVPIKERSSLLRELAHKLRQKRGILIAAMIADGGKSIPEADTEVSEAIDFVEYYRRNMEEISSLEGVLLHPKGTVLVAPPWNFPCSIPIGGISASLIAGNCVIFKPAPETVYVGWKLAEICWEAGIGKDVLQFVLCEDEPFGSQLIQDPRLSTVVLTGATETAKLMMRLRPGLNLIAETGGKNALIITSLSDRDLAARDLVNSAFGHSGQKCSACSLAICEREVYDDPHFRAVLLDAAASLKVGSAWEAETRVGPLIHEPNEALLKGLSTLEEGEEWLLAPKEDPENPNLWSPGIKLGVKRGGFVHRTELFGPVLGVMKAESLEEAVELANDTRYGLTSGIHSLDEREQKYWSEQIEAGNCYINRGITGAVVQRQPFGGCKESSFGTGAKAGGPNYVMQLVYPEEVSLPEKQGEPNGKVNMMSLHLDKEGISKEQKAVWSASVGSYAYYWKHYFSQEHDPSCILGQDNILRYVPHKSITFHISAQDKLLDIMRIIAAALTCGTTLELSGEKDVLGQVIRGGWFKLVDNFVVIEESEASFIERIKEQRIKRARFISPPSLALKQAMGANAVNAIVFPPVSNGRIELFHYLREAAFSIDYHRYGNLGSRENEVRSQII